jgi:tetratricopeptide (TPR) repeat protein
MNAWRSKAGLLLLTGLTAGCASPRGTPLDAELEMSALTARTAYEQGALDKAAALYRTALARARLTDNGPEIARGAYNLAICLTAAGRYEDARRLLVQARGGFGAAGRELAQSYLVEARICRLEGKGEDAVRLVHSALAAGGGDDCRVQAQLLLAEIALDSGDAAKAQAAFAPARKRLGRINNPRIRADAEGVAAQIALLSQQAATAAGHLDAKAGWLKAAGQYLDAAQTLRGAADAYAGAGRLADAFDRYLRAAHGLYGGGDGQRALMIVEQALKTAEALKDEGLRTRAAALRDEIRQALKP